MANTQSDLHRYFKIKKSTKNNLHIVDKGEGSNPTKVRSKTNVNDVKAFSPVEKIQISKCDASFPNPSKEASPCNEVEGLSCSVNVEKRSLCVNKVSRIKHLAVSKKQEEKKLQKNCEFDNGRQTPSKESEATTVKDSEFEVSASPVTPQFKIVAENEPSRKRKREALEGENDLLKIDSIPPLDYILPAEKKSKEKQPTAKKKLILEDNLQPEVPVQRKEKLNPDAVKRELGKCGRLDELRARLLKLNKCEEKLASFRNQAFKKKNLTPSSSAKETSEIKESCGLKFTSPYQISSRKNHRNFKSPIKDTEWRLGHFKSLDFEVPLSPYKSPVKSSTPGKSCQERFSHLIVPPSDQLYLPFRYQLVKEVFRAVDTVVSLLHNRQEVITYSKLKPAVQEMLRKTFSETHLGQIKTVFPLAYLFSQEKIKSKSSCSYNSVSYELTLKPNMNYKRHSGISRNLMKDFNTSDASQLETQYRKMDSVVLVERRHMFHSALLDILKRHHSKFLETLDHPIVLDGPLRRWHPEFPIEEVPPPSPSSLPQPPKEDNPDTAKDVLEKAKDIFSVNNRMKKAVESAVATTAYSSMPVQSPSVNDKVEVAAALKGVSLSLLEKIRAREAQKIARNMTRSFGASKELEMLSRLHELVRLIRGLFVSEKKAALPWETVTAKIVNSHSGSLSASEAESHLKLLMKEIPGWCTSHKVRCGLYLKIDKSRQLQEITEKLDGIIRAKT